MKEGTTMEYKKGEIYRRTDSLTPSEEDYDYYEVVLNAGELMFYSHSYQHVLDLDFLGHKELVKYDESLN